MTTETTTSLPPCPLPDCEGGEHHYHDTRAHDEWLAGEECEDSGDGTTRCYSQHRPGLPEPVSLPEVTDDMVECAQWQPIERDQIRAGMRIRATVVFGDVVATRTGVAHHTYESDDWGTESGWSLTGWAAPISYEVDPATIPTDLDAELIEAVAETLYRTDWPSDAWDGLSVEACRELARAALAAIRAHDEAVTGDE